MVARLALAFFDLARSQSAWLVGLQPELRSKVHSPRLPARSHFSLRLGLRSSSRGLYWFRVLRFKVRRLRGPQSRAPPKPSPLIIGELLVKPGVLRERFASATQANLGTLPERRRLSLSLRGRAPQCAMFGLGRTALKFGQAYEAYAPDRSHFGLCL